VIPTTQPWSKLSPVQKLVGAFNIIHKKGGLVFTLRLHVDDAAGLSGLLNPVRAMSRRIQRSFDRSGLPIPQLAFTLEVTPDAREELHLHGAIMMGDIPYNLMVQTLRQAGKLIVGRAGARQVQLKPFDLQGGGPAGWARYSMKCASRTRRVIDHDRVIYIARALNAQVRSEWNQTLRERGGMAVH
jgi:hypothetical protein